MTYDRYLLRSFLHTLVVCFVTTFGLIAVIDLFENFDEMLALNGDRGMPSLIGLIATLKSYESIMFIDRAGPILVVISVMTVLILLQRSGELHPLLAAGIPMYRILRPVIVASIAANGILMFNQEFLIPRVVFFQHELRHRNDPSQSAVEPLIDRATRISINGERVNVAERTIEKPEFTLPVPTVVGDITMIIAESGKFLPANQTHPSGWMLKNVNSPSTATLLKNLTDKGRELVKPQRNTQDVFVRSDVTCDQLFKRSSSFTSLSTPDLLSRIRSPAVGLASVQRLVLYLHSRFMQPLMNIIAVLLTVPLMVRRESPGLVADSSLCGFVLAVLFGVTQGFQSLGATHVITPELAAWGPVVIGGSLSAWLSGVIRT